MEKDLKNEFTRFYLNPAGTRWINVDSLGNKDKITLRTRKGKLETRTCQYWCRLVVSSTEDSYLAIHKGVVVIPKPELSTKEVIKCKITYKGKMLLVDRETILED